MFHFLQFLVMEVTPKNAWLSWPSLFSFKKCLHNTLTAEIILKNFINKILLKTVQYFKECLNNTEKAQQNN